MPMKLSRLLAAICLLSVLAAPAFSAPPPEHWRAVLVAGDTAQPVFDNATRAIDLWLARHGVAETDIHRLSAGARARDRTTEPATLERVLNRIAHLRSRPGDGYFIFITSHGGHGSGIYLSREDEFLRPSTLARALGTGCGEVPTVAIISGCYSGSFARGAMAAPNRIVLTAARADRPSFGCAAERTYTVFDACLLGSLPHATTWEAAFGEIKDCVKRRERQLNALPSLPQAWFGPALRRLPLQF